MACVMGVDRHQLDLSRSLQRGRLRWISLGVWPSRKKPTRRFWPRWIGEYKAEDVPAPIKAWGNRLRGARRGKGFLYVMWQQDHVWMQAGTNGPKIPGSFLISIYHVPHIDRDHLDCGLFTLKPPVKRWPQRIRV